MKLTWLFSLIVLSSLFYAQDPIILTINEDNIHKSEFEQIYWKNKKEAICLGARTGQEVYVLRELGLNCIGIDLVDFPPYTIKGDIHNLEFEDEKFDLIFTNILDHSLDLEKFISEMERVCVKDGIIILNTQENIPGDDYSENVINSPEIYLVIFWKSTNFLSLNVNLLLSI